MPPNPMLFKVLSAVALLRLVPLVGASNDGSRSSLGVENANMVIIMNDAERIHKAVLDTDLNVGKLRNEIVGLVQDLHLKTIKHTNEICLKVYALEGEVQAVKRAVSRIEAMLEKMMPQEGHGASTSAAATDRDALATN